MGIRNFRNMGILEQLVALGYLRLIKDITISGSATTSVTIDTDEDSQAFSFGKDSTLLLVSEITNPTTSNAEYNLYANNNQTATNYYRQLLLATSTTIVGNRANAPSIASITTQNDIALCYADIKLTNDSYYTAQIESTRGIGGSSPTIFDFYTTSTFTTTALTRFDIVASVANAIGVGSRFQLFEIVGG